jgi:glycosyltransferase involved in cell wall biosynthesis
MDIPKVLIIGGQDVDARIELMRLLDANYQIQAAGSSMEIALQFEKAGFVYYYYPPARNVNPFAYLASLISLVSIMRRERPQIVHTFDTKPSILGRLAAKISGIPIIIATITGLGSLYIIQGNLLPLLIRPVYEGMQKILCQISDLTIFYTKDDAAFFQSKGLAQADKIAVLPGSGVMLNRFSPDCFSSDEKDEIKRKLGVPPEHMVITMIARLVRSKGILLFADVARKIKLRMPGTHFLLIGPHNQESIDSLSVSEVEQLCEVIQWIGHQPQVEDYLAISDIFVLPAEREGIPRVLVEAASMGLPIVATDVPGCTEVVENNTNGFLVPAHDVNALRQAIETLVVEPKMREQFGNASRQRATALFDLSIISQQIRSIYDRLLLQKGLN